MDNVLRKKELQLSQRKRATLYRADKNKPHNESEVLAKRRQKSIKFGTIFAAAHFNISAEDKLETLD